MTALCHNVCIQMDPLVDKGMKKYPYESYNRNWQKFQFTPKFVSHWAIPFFNHMGGGMDKLFRVDIFCERELVPPGKLKKISISPLENM